MSDLARALRYPWKSKGWRWRMLTLALWQLIPIVGQVILVGYGLAIVRVAHRQPRRIAKISANRATS